MLVFVIWNVISWRFPFFWDTILNSRIAHWYVDGNMGAWTVPENLDAGHPPFFSRYLAAVWTVFGQSLAVAHIAMLPFLMVIVVQFYKLAKRMLKPELLPWAMAFLVLEPTFLAQSSMVTPDIALVCFYLLAVNSILEGRRWMLGAAMVAMAAMTMRGILAVPAVFLTDILLAWWAGKRKIDWPKILAYVPVTLLVLVWLYVHYKATGWLLSPPAETYGEHRQLLGLKGILRNVGIIGWRWMDYGRVILFVFVALIGFQAWRKSILPENVRKALAFFLVPALVWTLLFAPFSNPIGHRYFMVCYLFLGLAAAGLLQMYNSRIYKMVVGGLIAIALVSGHFWVYPETIAQGWDASLAHLRYFGLKTQMDRFLDENGIPVEQVCSDFPLLSKKKFTHVLDVPETGGPIHMRDVGFSECKWILQSNISNGFADEEIAELRSEGKWKSVHLLKSGNVYIWLYERK